MTRDRVWIFSWIYWTLTTQLKWSANQSLLPLSYIGALNLISVTLRELRVWWYGAAWEEDVLVIYKCCWPWTAESFSGPSLVQPERPGPHIYIFQKQDSLVTLLSTGFPLSLLKTHRAILEAYEPPSTWEWQTSDISHQNYFKMSSLLPISSTCHSCSGQSWKESFPSSCSHSYCDLFLPLVLITLLRIDRHSKLCQLHRKHHIIVCLLANA
jgi:hypothetical protein